MTRRSDFIEFFPYSKRLAVTLIATLEVIEPMVNGIPARYPYVYIDLIVAQGDLSEVSKIPHNRVEAKRRSG